MSDITAPKKSILTSAMEKVAAKKDANDSDENTLPLTDEAAAKRLIKKAGIALLGTAAIITAAIVIANRLSNEDETSEETETTED